MKGFRKYWRVVFMALASVLAFAQALVVSAAPAVYTWGSYDSSGSSLGFTDENDQPLETGDVVQLIWVGPNGRIDPPQASTGATTIDDQLLQSSPLPLNANYPPPLRNKGYMLAQFNYDTDQPYHNGLVYMRAWNAGVAGRNGGATLYGDSNLMTLTANGNGVQLGVRTSYSTGTAVQLSTVNVGAQNQSLLWLVVFVLLSLSTAVQASWVRKGWAV